MEVLAANTLDIHLPQATKSGNAVVCGVGYNVESPALVAWLSDDGGNTWNLPVDVNDGNTQHRIYYALNTNTSMTKATLTITGKPSVDGVGISGFWGTCSQFDNIATSSALDGACEGYASTGTTMTCNSSSFGTCTVGCNANYATTVDNDLLYQWAVDNDGTNCGGATAPPINNFSASSPFTLRLANSVSAGNSLAAVDGVQVSHGSITPSFTQSCGGTGGNWVLASIALKSASSGSVYSGIRVNSNQVIALENNALSGTHQETINIPGSGNELVFRALMQGANDITAITTANPSCTITQVNTVFGSGSTPANNAGDAQTWAGPCTMTSTTTATITYGTLASVTGSTVETSDLAGCAASCIDTSATTGGSGNCTSGSCIQGGNQVGSSSPYSLGAIITPSTSSGVVLSQFQVLSQTAYCLTLPSGVNCTGQDQNNTWGDYYYSSNASQSYTTTTNNSPGGSLGQWGIKAVAFKAAAAPVGLIKRRITGVY